MGTVVSFAPDQRALDEAWNAYDAAQLDVVRLYRDEGSTPVQRRAATVEAIRLHDALVRTMRRAGAS